MSYDSVDWVEDIYHCIAWADAPADASVVRERLERRFLEVHPTVEDPKWWIDRLLFSYLWIRRHVHELDTPSVVVGEKSFAISRYLCEALWRIAMRVHTHDLHKEVDVSLVSRLTKEQHDLDEKKGA